MSPSPFFTGTVGNFLIKLFTGSKLKNAYKNVYLYILMKAWNNTQMFFKLHEFKVHSVLYRLFFTSLELVKTGNSSH